MSATMIAAARDKQAKAKAHKGEGETTITHTNPFDAPPPSETVLQVKQSVVVSDHAIPEPAATRPGPCGKNVMPPKQTNKNHVHCH